MIVRLALQSVHYTLMVERHTKDIHNVVDDIIHLLHCNKSLTSRTQPIRTTAHLMCAVLVQRLGSGQIVRTDEAKATVDLLVRVRTQYIEMLNRFALDTFDPFDTSA